MTRVVHVRSREWAEAVVNGTAVYIGRAVPRAKGSLERSGSIWANLFKEGMDPFKVMRLLESMGWRGEFKFTGPITREQSIDLYRELMTLRLNGRDREWWAGSLKLLRGKTLGCWCKPLPCHGDVLVELLEART